jgi:hypothetical protein
MRKIAKDMFYSVDMVISLEEIYIAITGQRPPKNTKALDLRGLHLHR